MGLLVLAVLVALIAAGCNSSEPNNTASPILHRRTRDHHHGVRGLHEHHRVWGCR